MPLKAKLDPNPKSAPQSLPTVPTGKLANTAAMSIAVVGVSK